MTNNGPSDSIDIRVLLELELEGPGVSIDDIDDEGGLGPAYANINGNNVEILDLYAGDYIDIE